MLMMLMKLMLLHTAARPGPQLVAMSATLPNVEQVARWLDAESYSLLDLTVRHDLTTAEVADVLSRNGGNPGHIFNLGHGVGPHTLIPGVEAMVAAVREGRW